MRVISGFRREGDEICALLGRYVAYSGNSLLTFRGNLSVHDCFRFSIFSTHHLFTSHRTPVFRRT